MAPAMYSRINIFGAPGSGVSTLGKGLAAHLGYAFFDTDDYYWYTADALPFRRKRNPEHRLRLLTQDLAGVPQYVVAGALLGWGAPLLEQMDAVVYRWLPVDIRHQRIREREIARYGAERLAPGGDVGAVYEKFQAWAAGYDSAGPDRQRGGPAELLWLKSCNCPVLYLDQDWPMSDLIGFALEFLQWHYS